MEMRLACVFILSAYLGACATLGSTLNLPPASVHEGVRVTVDGLYRQGLAYVGVAGTAKNTSDRDYTMCSLSFDVLDSKGAKVADAIATTMSFSKGQTWRFQAIFSAPFGSPFKSIGPAKVTVVKTAEDMQANIRAQMAANAAASPAVDPHTRLMGIHCTHRLPNGAILPRISQLTPGGLAEEAGWQVGDLVLSVDGQEVNSLTELVLATQRGRKRKVYMLQRGEQTIESALTFAQ